MKLTRLGWLVVAATLVACAVDTTAEEQAGPEEVAAASSELSRNDLSLRQEATALKLIDDICGDTWCEGDHNFRFDRLECRNGCGESAGTCKLTFRIFSHETDMATGPTYTRVCKTPDFTGFDSLVQTQGSYQSLQWTYYEALTDCIARMESHLPR